MLRAETAAVLVLLSGDQQWDHCESPVMWWLYMPESGGRFSHREPLKGFLSALVQGQVRSNCEAFCEGKTGTKSQECSVETPVDCIGMVRV